MILLNNIVLIVFTALCGYPIGKMEIAVCVCVWHFQYYKLCQASKKIVVKLCWRCDGEVWEGRLGTWSSTGGCHCPSFSSSTRSWCIKDIKCYSNNHFSLFCCWTAGNLPDSILWSLANGMLVTKLRPMIYQCKDHFPDNNWERGILMLRGSW